MKVVCAWCGKRISGNPFSKDISHGCCEKCHEKELEKISLWQKLRGAK